MSRARTVFMVFLAASLGACQGFSSEEEGLEVEPRIDSQDRIVLSQTEVDALNLHSVKATSGTVSESRVRFGRVVATPSADVAVVAPVQSRVGRVAATLGQEVEMGTPLLTLEPSVDAVARADFATRLTQLRGKIIGSRARAKAGAVELTRVSGLVEAGLATPAQRAKASADLESERATTAGLERSVHILEGYAGGQIELKAPSAGILAEIETATGSMLQQGQRVALILGAGSRWIDLAVPPDDPTGDAYHVDLRGAKVKGRLLARGQLVEDGMRVDRVEVSGKGASALAPGRIVSVAVVREIPGVVVPRASVLHRGGKEVVFVELREGLYELRPVCVAGLEGDRVALADGLAAQERVAVQGAMALLGEMGFSGRLDSSGLDGAGSR